MVFQWFRRGVIDVNQGCSSNFGTVLGIDSGTDFSGVAMPKWSRRWPAKPILVGSSPTATSIQFHIHERIAKSQQMPILSICYQREVLLIQPLRSGQHFALPEYGAF